MEIQKSLFSVTKSSLSFSLLQVLESLSRLVKALSILEKYGCNLTSPARPRFWRSVKHNNPVFRATVDAIKVSKKINKFCADVGT